ncbi:diacylglycerol kinase [Accumulibacter sp.]|uniref:diacylglycerol kinase n=1 Tax=Accumulibacter sp. TaxID=2053492 RepID=UPI0028C490DD|nr:diacylglycerol kinase [Accumulibacter sp.]
MKNQVFTKKLRNAFAGIGFAWTEERNFRVHVALGLATLLAFAVLQPTAWWWALIVLCVALVLAAELLNSAVEALVDHLHPELHPLVGKVKDMLAGMVLVISVGAAVVAMLALYATVAAWSP